MAALKKEVRKVNGVSNKVGTRDNGRAVRSIPTAELKELHQKIMKQVKGRRDRQKIEMELRRRGETV